MLNKNNLHSHIYVTNIYCIYNVNNHKNAQFQLLHILTEKSSIFLQIQRDNHLT